MSSWDVNAFLVANGTDLVVNKDGKKDLRLNFDDSKVRESLNFFREISFVNKGFIFWQGWSPGEFPARHHRDDHGSLRQQNAFCLRFVL